MNRGFTLIELVIVVIIIAILSSISFIGYAKMIEKSRVAEAKVILGQIRTAETAYYIEYGRYQYDINGLGVNAPPACVSTHFFWYKIDDSRADDCYAAAYRCTGDTGKRPAGPQYYIEMNMRTGYSWSQPAGYD